MFQVAPFHVALQFPVHSVHDVCVSVWVFIVPSAERLVLFLRVSVICVIVHDNVGNVNAIIERIILAEPVFLICKSALTQ